MNLDLSIIIICSILVVLITLILLLDIRLRSYTRRKYARLYWVLDSGLKINFLSRHKFTFNNQGRYLYDYQLYSKFMFKLKGTNYHFIPILRDSEKEQFDFHLSKIEFIQTIEDLFTVGVINKKDVELLLNINTNQDIVIENKFGSAT